MFQEAPHPKCPYDLLPCDHTSYSYETCLHCTRNPIRPIDGDITA